MINKVLQIIAPHHCYGCQKTGSPLCDNCKYDIVDEPFDGCIVCARPANDGICANCRTAYEKAWCVGDRSGTLERLIDAYKFERVKDAGASLAGLIDSCLPVMPASTAIVPVPTLRSHVRQRGYDHTLQIARELARLRGLTVTRPLVRRGRSVQRDRNRKERFEQAAAAFSCDTPLDPTVPYLLIDDVVTTNATVRHCAVALKAAGAERVWVAAVARQPLDK